MDNFELHYTIEIAHEIGHRAKVLRKTTKMTQKGFAEFSGIPFGTYMRSNTLLFPPIKITKMGEPYNFSHLEHQYGLLELISILDT